jgi:inosose dehydratase
MDVKVGSAPDSWGVWFPSDAKQTPWHRFMDEVAEAGYKWIELGPYGYLPNDLPTLRAELDKRGLKVSGSFVLAPFEDTSAWPPIEQQARNMGTLLAGVGAQYMVLIDDSYSDLFTGKRTASPTLDDDQWKRLVETVHKLADLAHDEFGLKAVFHPHAETHIEYESQIEKLLHDTDPDKLFLCLDTGHHAYRGGDPVSFMRKHQRRIPYLHLKSVDRDKQRQVEADNIPFAIAVGQDMFCEPSMGALDFISFRDLLREINYDGFGIVEQDMYPAPFDKPLPIARRTRAYLREIGLG